MFEWHKTIQAMVDIIEKQLYYNFDEEITLTSLAKELGYSKFHITKRFKSLTGMTFRDYLRLRRLAYSVIELRDTNNRIIDVASSMAFVHKRLTQGRLKILTALLHMSTGTKKYLLFSKTNITPLTHTI